MCWGRRGGCPFRVARVGFRPKTAGARRLRTPHPPPSSSSSSSSPGALRLDSKKERKAKKAVATHTHTPAAVVLHIRLVAAGALRAPHAHARARAAAAARRGRPPAHRLGQGVVQDERRPPAPGVGQRALEPPVVAVGGLEVAAVALSAEREGLAPAGVGLAGGLDGRAAAADLPEGGGAAGLAHVEGAGQVLLLKHDEVVGLGRCCLGGWLGGGWERGWRRWRLLVGATTAQITPPSRRHRVARTQSQRGHRE